jgi:hypothetical protein
MTGIWKLKGMEESEESGKDYALKLNIGEKMEWWGEVFKTSPRRLICISCLGAPLSFSSDFN